jgi:hypothetical protein
VDIGCASLADELLVLRVLFRDDLDIDAARFDKTLKVLDFGIRLPVGIREVVDDVADGGMFSSWTLGSQ